MTRPTAFVTGGTGYMGRRLIPRLVTRGYEVHALVRHGSENKLPPGAIAVVGNVLDAATFAGRIPRDAVVVHLVGTPRPSPAKAAEFEAVDLVSARECIAAARTAGAKHFVYVSVAQPAPIMRAYVAVRARGEAILRESGIPHTILRPWYVLGPGHRWAYLLIPLYWYWNATPSTRDTAQRLGLLTLDQMLSALTWAVTTATQETRLLEVPSIRRFSSKAPLN
ncbi:MAG: SDR family oxidoreductase [Gemmatimonadaceae bacterium]